MTDLLPLFHNPLFLTALLASFLAALIGGTVGSLIVVRRITFISGSISHSILAGAGLFLWLERTWNIPYLSPLLGALFSAILSALLIAKATTQKWIREDAIIASIWASGMAIGIIFIAKTPGYTTDLSNLLIGNILWTTREDLLLLMFLAVVSLVFIFRNFQKIKLLVFDIDEAKLQNIPTESLYRSLLLLIAIAVVALTQVVGIVLVMTMLTLPQLLAITFSKKLSSIMISSIVISFACSFFGLGIAFVFDWPAGASISLTTTVAYLLFTLKGSM